MFYQSRPAEAPRLETLRVHVRKALLQAREAWQKSNPWIPVDWESVQRQQKGAADAMREAERTQKQGELEARRKAEQRQSLRVRSA